MSMQKEKKLSRVVIVDEELPSSSRQRDTRDSSNDEHLEK
jgi:hypothetical protein